MPIDLGDVVARKKVALAKMITLLEDIRPQQRSDKAELFDTLQQKLALGWVLGLTGPPGVGKSSLIMPLVKALRDIDSTISVAMVAIDPSSQKTGGSILGDRSRVNLDPKDLGLYFRSQPNRTESGGLAPSTYMVVLALAYLFDIVVVETVGVGQNEVDIRQLADKVALLLNPLGGDGLQAIKAGVMEIPDWLVVTKADAADARSRRNQLASQFPNKKVFAVSSHDGSGIPELAQTIDEARDGARQLAAQGAFFLKRWVEIEYGKFGARAAFADLSESDWLAKYGSLPAAQSAIAEKLEA